MQKKLLLFIVTLFSISCNNSPEQTKNGSADSITPSVHEQLSDLPWITAINPKTGITYLEHMPGNTSAITPQQVIDAANKKYPQIQLEWIKKDGATAYLKIADATYLTQSMGSAGAEAYLSEITYSFTEIKGITAINLDFTEGDHASPGVFTREQFKSLMN